MKVPQKPSLPAREKIDELISILRISDEPLLRHSADVIEGLVDAIERHESSV